MRISLVGPFPPPTGGVAIQAQLLAKRLKEEKVYFYQINTNRKLRGLLGIVSDIPGLRTAIKFCLHLFELLRILPHSDVVHLFASSNGSFFLESCPTILIGRIFRRRLIVNYHGGQAEVFLKRWKIIVLPFLRLADVIVVPSDFLKNVFRKYSIRAAVIHNMIDLKYFLFKPQKELKKRLINTRHLIPMYNLECTLRAFKIIKEKIPQVVLVFAGTGPEEYRLRRMVQKMRLSDVIFMGGVQYSKMPEIYKEGGVFINSSWVDNMPVSILEAFASGIPVVSTNVGGIPCVVRDGWNGLLVKPNNHKDLATQVLQLFEIPDLALKLSENGHTECKKYNWLAIKDRLFEIYKGNG